MGMLVQSSASIVSPLPAQCRVSQELTLQTSSRPAALASEGEPWLGLPAEALLPSPHLGSSRVC